MMIQDAIMELLDDSYSHLLTKNFEITASLYEHGVVGIDASDDKLLFALGLKRQREKSGSTIRDVYDCNQSRRSLLS